MNLETTHHQPSPFLGILDYSTGPYFKAADHFSKFSEYVYAEKKEPGKYVREGIKEFSLGLLFSIPLINTIAFVAYAILNNRHISQADTQSMTENFSETEELVDTSITEITHKLDTIVSELGQIQDQRVCEAISKIRQFFRELDDNHSVITIEFGLKYIYSLTASLDINNNLKVLGRYLALSGQDEKRWDDFTLLLDDLPIFLDTGERVTPLKTLDAWNAFEDARPE